MAFAETSKYHHSVVRIAAHINDNEPMKQFKRVNAQLEQTLDLTPAERKELISSLLFFDLALSEQRKEDA